jgi:hypothetical protein
VPGKTPREAVQNYVTPLQQAVSCVSKAVLRPSGYDPSDEPLVLLSQQMPDRLATTDLYFDVAQWFRIIEDPANGPWRVTTEGYKYTIETEDGEEILGYHWHPRSLSHIREPHLHLGTGARIGRSELETAKAHLPTGRVSMEDFIQLLIEVFAAHPRRDWRTILKATGDLFWKYASWGKKPSRT